MKAIRSYHVRGSWVWCHVDFVADDEDFEKDAETAFEMERWSISMRATVGYISPKTDKECPLRFFSRAHPNLRSSVVFEECERFLSTLKTMYDL